MSKLDKLIGELCPDGVEYVKLGDILENNNAKHSITKKNYEDSGKVPIIDQSQLYVAGFTNNLLAVPPIIPTIIFGDHTRIVKYIDFEFAQGASGTRVFVPKEPEVNTKYIYYVFSNLDIPSRGYNRHWSIVKEMKVPLPPLPVQEEIVSILDNFTELTIKLQEELNKELTARKKQYEYYRDELLTFGDEVEWKMLGDISQYSKNRVEAKKLDENNYVGVDNLLPDKKGKAKSEFVPTDGRLTKFKEEDILIGNIRPYLRKIWFSSMQGGTNSDVLVIQVTNNINLLPRFLFHILSSESFFFYNIQHSRGAKMPRGDKKAIMRFQISVPPLSEQERIVSILDKFDALVNDISIGLPAEIETRQKQYEYYREKLLTFKELDRKEA